MHSIQKGLVLNMEKCIGPCSVPQGPIADINASMAFVILLQGLTGLAISSCLIASAKNASRNPSLALSRRLSETHF